MMWDLILMGLTQNLSPTLLPTLASALTLREHINVNRAAAPTATPESGDTLRVGVASALRLRGTGMLTANVTFVS